MQWSEARAAHPDQWVVVEVLESHRVSELHVVDRMRVIERYADGHDAMRRCNELSRELPKRELCFGHTGNAQLAFEERLLFRGIRAAGVSI